jgi:hypothetical protein
LLQISFLWSGTKCRRTPSNGTSMSITAAEG